MNMNPMIYGIISLIFYASFGLDLLFCLFGDIIFA